MTRRLPSAPTSRHPGISRRSALALPVALALLASALTGAGPATAAPPDSPAAEAGAPGGSVAPADALSDAKVSRAMAEATGHVTAFVQLDAPSALDVHEDGGDAAQVQAATEQVEQLAEAVIPAEAAAPQARSAQAGEPQRISTLTNVIAGSLVSGDAAQLRALAERDDVVAVHQVTPRTIDNTSSDALTRALDVWQSTGQTGEGIRIGIIDTGVDYTHAAFGGPGTQEAYAAAYGADGTGPVPDGLFDGAKYLGGRDFAGHSYDANPASALPGATTVPTPDDNPIDSLATSPNSGHGTHVAGTAAGYGVQADGATFRGDYAALSDLTGWQVGPGSAPGASVYALKVFGDIGGSTNLTAQALDWAADPNGDGDLNDHLDVVNLSLGASATPSDDPDNLLIDRLADLGVLSVLSAGNSGDITDVGGSPGSAASGLTVANSVGSPLTLDGVEVTAAPDAALLGAHAAQHSVAYAGDQDVTAPVAFLGETVSGCSSLAGQSAEITGKVVYLSWDDDDATRACGSGARFNNAQAAGAVGVLLGTERAVFSGGIAGNAAIPGAQLTASATDTLLPAIRTGAVSVRLGPSLAASVNDDSAGDVLNPGSSRGAHGSLGIAKPDVAAPGTSILSAASGSGSAAHSLSGTSMSAPHVAGIAALVRAAHPGWTPAEAKAAVMNTATHDVFTGARGTGDVYGPQRVGSGRVDAADAVAASVLAFGSEDPDQVSVTFGVVPVGAETVVQRKTVTVRNTGSTAVRYSTSFAAATTTGGATITTSPATITVQPGRTQLVTLTLTADPATLARDLDPTSAATQGGLPREHVAALTGRLLLTSGGTELRVPVQAAPRLVSSLTAADIAFPDAGAVEAELALTGRGIASGGWTSLVAPLQLAATSPRLERAPGLVTSDSSVAAGDVRAVGWASTAPQRSAAGLNPAGGYLGVGIAVDGEWATLGQSVLPVIDLDLDGDGAYDRQTVVQKLNEATDVTVQLTYDYTSGELLDAQPVNGFFGDVDTTVFDNNVVLVPLSLADVGITPGSTPTLRVWTHSQYAADPSRQVDAVEPFTVDPYAPALWFDGGAADAFWSVGEEGAVATVHRDPAAAELPQVLVLHSHNATTTTRTQVLDVTVPTATPPSASTTTAKALPRVSGYGSAASVAVTVTGASAGPTGTVEVRLRDTVIATGALTVDGLTGTATVPLPRDLAVGAHTLTVAYTGSVEVSASSATVGHVVLPALTRLSVATTSWSVPRGSTPALTVKAAGADGAPAPTGAVRVLVNGRTVATPALVDGAATVTLPPVTGRAIVTVSYGGDGGYLPAVAGGVLTARR
ncbi:S8 family serine peptidase [Cellulomonas cellasea]|uniref:S8 family serine peptidase n=1 Tax=Cellulomonas cellasea TaxID=43670 RepID=UPI0025A403FF|nr:S8 family serine peptidase [Cellulomonas cellasea]MDM8086276.1 S8 family serine peptidase [Cellulomonas cellasea]